VWTASDGEEKKGLAQHATLGITPQTSSLGKAIEPKTKQRKPAKMTSEQFLEKTKEMSDSQFVNYILEANGDTEISTVSDLFGNEFTPDPTQTIQYVAGLLTGNDIF